MNKLWLHTLSIKVLSDPVHYFHLFIALLRGTWFIVFYTLFKANIYIGFPFFAACAFRIYGPGKVHIGKRCYFAKSSLHDVVICTLSRNAFVTIGNNCCLGGTLIRSAHGVAIGDKVTLSFSLIQDVLMVHQARVKTNRIPFTSGNPIAICSGVWLSIGTIVLAGSKIGRDSVLSLGSVCVDQNIGVYMLAVGNPAIHTHSIAVMQKLMR